MPDWLPSVPGEEGKRDIVVPDVATLLYYANLGAIEFHTTLARLDEPEESSVLSFDLDPSTDDFNRLKTVALYLHDVLLDLGLHSLVKTSGKSGLQVFIPLAAKVPFAQTRKLVAFVARYMEQRWPDLVTTDYVGRIARGLPSDRLHHSNGAGARSTVGRFVRCRKKMRRSSGHCENCRPFLIQICPEFRYNQSTDRL